MKVFATGEQNRIDELKQIIPASVELKINTQDTNSLMGVVLHTYDVIIDLNFDDSAHNLMHYVGLYNKIIICGAVKKCLAEVLHTQRNKIESTFIGMNTLPTFINRSKIEVSFQDLGHINLFDPIAKQLNWDYLQVEDRVGMVTPRVICMVINEACNTLQEGAASKEDIDKGMVLGTAYPMGPLLWADKIGINHVYETLEAIYNDTHDERYKTSPLLKQMYLKRETFYK